jgi:hypothetical protein
MAASDFVSIVFVLRCGQPGSRPGHRNEVAFFDDWRASPDDLRLAIRPNVEVGQPDVVTIRMRANLDNSPHHDAFGVRDHQANLAPHALSRYLNHHGFDLGEAGSSDGGTRGPHAPESVPRSSDVVRIHDHIAVGITVSPDGATKPHVVAEVISDLRVQCRFLSLQSNCIEPVKQYTGHQRSSGHAERAIFPYPVTANLVSQQLTESFYCRIPRLVLWQNKSISSAILKIGCHHRKKASRG